MRTLLTAYHEAFLEHDPGPGHPDRPERVTRALAALEKAPWRSAVRMVTPRAATHEELGMVHNPRYPEAMRRLCDAGGQFLPKMQAAVGRESYQAALFAAGAGLTLADKIMEGEASVGFAPTRPPGHHAVRERPGGFCVFNNAAVLAQYLRVKHGLKRVAVVDFDIHFGNGTVEAFWTDPSVLVCSLHRKDHYPAGRDDWHHRGEGEGEGFTVNVPLPEKVGDADYLNAFDRYVAPAIKEFAAEFLVISAGFDGHWRDLLGGTRLTSRAYGGLGRRLRKFADATAKGRLIALLEGGYDLLALEAGLIRFLEPLVIE